MKNNKVQLSILMIVILLIGLVGGGYFGVTWAKKNTADDGSSMTTLTDEDDKGDNSEKNRQEIQKINQAKNYIKKHYVEDVKTEDLTEGAIKGMLETLDDPYSSYMDAEMMKDFDQEIESSFEGIGAEVSMQNNKVTIVSPIKGSPAEKKGLRSNDKILKIDGKSTDGLDLNEAVDKIRGEKGSKVKLTIERAGAKKPFDVELTRADIPIETVYPEIEKTNGKKTGVLKLTSFSENTADDFKDELDKMEEKNIDGLVIDVRGNPGGLLDSVDDILKELIPKDKPYLQIEDRNGKKEKRYSEIEEKKPYPITVLTDEGSASASEILAVALKETGYQTVGTKSYGKGSVQQAGPLDDKSRMKLTLFKWLSPNGKSINKKGIKPSVKVKQPAYYYAHPVQIDKPLKYDQVSDDVENIQIMLHGLGYKLDRQDGYYDKQTEKAVKAFQKEQSLKQTGIVNKETGAAIETEVLKHVRDGKDDKQLAAGIKALY